MSEKKVIIISLAVALIVALGVRSFYVKHPVLSGETMGTTYEIKLKGYVMRSAVNALEIAIDRKLADINRQMSTWDPESEISLFNQWWSESNAFPASPEFASIVARALEFSESSDGAFDPTLLPLLNLWGFGHEGAGQAVPSDEEIDEAWQYTGPEMVWIEETTNLWKAAPEVQLDLGAIAKGYGVDAIGELLDQAGFGNWFVEIGGEVGVRGHNPQGQPWSIGIQYPSSNAAVDRLQGILHLTEGAVATSGDYRNFIQQDGTVYSHILDPWSGRSVLSDTASVTVIAPNCLDADSAATALFVLGPVDGLAWVEEHPEAEALFLVRGADGEIFERFSSGFTNATGYVSRK